MSSKISTLLAAGVLLLGGAAALTPYGLGARVEEQFRGNVATLSSGGLKGQVVEYRRGWLDSDAVTDWTVRQEGETVTFRLAHQLRHGPTLSGALTEIESTVVLPDEFRQQLKAYLGEQPPVTVATRIGFDGAQRHQLSVPAHQGNVEGAQLDWAGARGIITVDAGITRIDGSFNAPRLLVEEGATKRKLGVTGTQMSFRYHRASQDASWLGGFDYSMDEISGTEAADPSANVTVATTADEGGSCRRGRLARRELRDGRREAHGRRRGHRQADARTGHPAHRRGCLPPYRGAAGESCGEGLCRRRGRGGDGSAAGRAAARPPRPLTGARADAAGGADEGWRVRAQGARALRRQG